MDKRFIIDTDTWIEYFHNRHGIKERLEAVDFKNIFISEISIAELYFGALHSKKIEQHLQEVNIIKGSFTVLPISGALMQYAELRQSLSSCGLTVDHFDLLIGATALCHDLTLVTHNIKHFSRIENLKIEDWFTS